MRSQMQPTSPERTWASPCEAGEKNASVAQEAPAEAFGTSHETGDAPAGAALYHLEEVACDAWVSLEEEGRWEQAAHQARADGSARELTADQADVVALQNVAATREAEASSLQAQMAALQTELEGWRQQHFILSSYAHS